MNASSIGIALSLLAGGAGEAQVRDRDTTSKRLRPMQPVVRGSRNEPCPCGSGRKFKRCCIGTLTISTEQL